MSCKGPEESAATSRRMAAVRSRDTTPELVLRRALWARGHRYRLHAGDLFGRPDVVFRGSRVAVFVDGDFWHGRLIHEGRSEAFTRQLGQRRDWWLAKVQRNIDRDSDVRETLEADGWVVVRIWESEIHTDLTEAVQKIECALGLRDDVG